MHIRGGGGRILRTRPYQRSQKPVPPGLKKIHAMGFSTILSARELLGRPSCGGRPVAARLASDTLCDMKRRGSRNGEARSGPLVPQSASRHHCRAGINGRREPALVVRRSRSEFLQVARDPENEMDDKTRDIYLRAEFQFRGSKSNFRPWCAVCL